MIGSGSARTMPLGPVTAVAAFDDRRPPDLPAPLSGRQLRRARLVARLARRRLGFLLLHVGLGLLGWGLVAMMVTGAASLIR